MRKGSKNNDLLNSCKKSTSPKIYDILLNLVNDDREDLAKEVIKVDYLLQYASSCIKAKDFIGAKEALKGARSRMDSINKSGGEIDYLEFLYEGIDKKVSKK